jgi:hypothetical protein
MKPRLPVVLVLLACLSFAASAQEPIPHNQWATLVSGGEKTTLPGNPIQSPDYFAWAPIVVQPGGKYTLFAEWDDGKAMLVIFQGHDPRAAAPSLPSGAAKMATINITGGGAYRINFTVDPKSAGDTAWVVFPAATPNRSLRIMIKAPGDPDAVTEAPVKGFNIGSVYKTPLHLFAR